MMAAKWEEYNFEVRRDTHRVLLSYPGGEGKRNQVRMLTYLQVLCW